MRIRLGLSCAAAVAALGVVAATASAVVPGTSDARRSEAALSVSSLPGAGTAGICDPIDLKACLLPFPNDFFTVADPSTATGRRVSFNPLAMPRNRAGKPVDPTEWNRQDGFSPGSMVLTYVPGLDLHATWGSPLDNLQDLSWYARPDAPIVIIDAATGERHPFWSEPDSHPDASPDRRLLILRPAVNFTEGHRYIVALRRLRRSDGSLIPAGEAFTAYRSGKAHDARAAHMESLFGSLAAAGVARSDLYLAWDFTVASGDNLAGRFLHIRDDAFAQLGDDDLADGVVAGRAPAFSITKVTDFPDGATMRRVEGTITVPNYLTPQVTGVVTSPEELRPVLGPIADMLPSPADELGGGEVPYAVPGSRLMPGLIQDPVQPTVDVPFLCNIARGSDVTPSHPYLYGHGLLGDRGEANGGSTEDLRLRGFSPCAVDWWGMSGADLANVASILVDFSNFPSLADRAQQGLLNFLYLGRALIHSSGLTTAAAFRGPDGAPLVRSGELYYVGNSQGGIIGGALTAVAPDFARAVLGVAGMNYSTLLNRSVDWENSYAHYAEASYPDELQKQLIFAVVQMLWDRAEADGYAQHMTTSPLPGTPAHQVMLQLAFSDFQVANVSAEVEGRTIGAVMHTPPLGPGLHWASDPAFGFPSWDGAAPLAGQSVLVYWYSADRGLATPPNGNLPPVSGHDPHEDPRRDNAGSDQVAHFLLTGEVVDVCHGPCVTTDATRRNS